MHLQAGACTNLIQVSANITLPTRHPPQTRHWHTGLPPAESPGWLMRAGQNHPGKERARNLSQTAVNLRRGHAALPDKDTNGSTGSRPSGGFQVMLPAMRREPAGRGYLVSHSFAQNRNRACSHPPLTFLQLSEGGKCLAITHYGC